MLICHRQDVIFTVPSLLSRHQLDSEAEDTKISYKMHTQVRRMMSEKRQRKKNVKTGEGEPQIQVTEEVEGRVAGPAKTLMDANVYDLMAEEEMPPPPPYTSNSGGKTRVSSSFRLAGKIYTWTGTGPKTFFRMKNSSICQVMHQPKKIVCTPSMAC